MDAAHRRSGLTATALGRLAAGAGSAAVLVTGALFTRELGGPAAKALATSEGGMDGLALMVLPLFWGGVAFLAWCLVLPTWRGHRWGRRALGACSFAACLAALHWPSYEPVPGSGSWRVGITVAGLFATGAAATVLAERVDERLGRLGIAGAALGAATIIIGSVSALDTSCDTDAEISFALPSSGGEPTSLAAVSRFAESERGRPLYVPASGWKLVSEGQSQASYQAQDVRVTVLRLEDNSWVVEHARCISG